MLQEIYEKRLGIPNLDSYMHKKFRTVLIGLLGICQFSHRV